MTKNLKFINGVETTIILDLIIMFLLVYVEAAKRGGSALLDSHDQSVSYRTMCFSL